MALILGIALVILGIALGFIVTYLFGLGQQIGLFIGVLLVIAGGIVGFVVEWLIDEAYRRNRELRQQLGERSNTAVTVVGATVRGETQKVDDTASDTLAEFLRQRDQDLHELREQLAAHEGQMDGLRGEFDAYQRTHPDDLTVIKGIGPVFQWKLRDIGFNTYKQLAAADPEQLRRMLDIKSWRKVNVEAWIAQARDWSQRGQ